MLENASTSSPTWTINGDIRSVTNVIINSSRGRLCFHDYGTTIYHQRTDYGKATKAHVGDYIDQALNNAIRKVLTYTK